MSYRNSKIYRLASKLLSPISKFLHPAHTADLDFNNLPVQFDSASVNANWHWYQPELISSSFSEASLVMTCLKESVWYQNLRGPMLYRYVKGDCVVSVTVKTRKSSNTEMYPDSQWQFGGLVFRDPSSDAGFSRENYVFNVVGFRATALQIETKSTHNGYSDVSAIDWDSGDAELMIERRGPLFFLKAKSAGADEWLDICEYARPDFPEIMQLGIIVYAYSEGRRIFDLRAEFDDFIFTST